MEQTCCQPGCAWKFCGRDRFEYVRHCWKSHKRELGLNYATRRTFLPGVSDHAEQCFGCQGIYKNAESLRFHLRSSSSCKVPHDNAVGFLAKGRYCADCGFDAVDPKELERHRDACSLSASSILPMDAMSAPAVFDKRSAEDAELVKLGSESSKKQNTTMKCQTCGISYSSSASFSRHVCDRREPVIHRCDVCGAQFPNRLDALKRHLATHDLLSTFSPLLIPGISRFNNDGQEIRVRTTYWVRSGMRGVAHRVHVFLFEEKGKEVRQTAMLVLEPVSRSFHRVSPCRL